MSLPEIPFTIRVHKTIVKTFYFINLKETSKNSVQSLYYCLLKLVSSVSGIQEGRYKKKKLKLKTKVQNEFPYFQKVTAKGACA